MSVSPSVSLYMSHDQYTQRHSPDASLPGRACFFLREGGKERKVVIQGLHMVSGTQCPAGSDPVEKLSASRAAAPKGQCPAEHRGEFPDILRGHMSGLR